jgi:hypothetical protein
MAVPIRGGATAPRAGRRGHFVVPLLAALIGSLTIAAPAQGSFHWMKIREIFTGGAAGGSYVELQMWTSGQNFVSGHPIVVYNSNGSVKHSFSIPSDVSNGSSQATVLIAGPGYSGPTADATDSGLDLPPAGGAVCFTQGDPPDCVSWGNFTGNASLPAPGAGTPESPGGVAPGMALHRSIAPGCATLLEPSDDTDDSATDFSEQAPNPRPNASSIGETNCIAPSTTIGTKPANPTNSTSATFAFSAPGGATFQCALDAGSFAACDSGTITYPGPLSEVSHRFEVRATNANGTGPTASYTWRIDLTAPAMTINTKPTDPSSGASATFTYQPSETVRSTQCKLDTPSGMGSFVSCAAGSRTYTGLADGEHTFSVRATDSAGNQSAPAAFPSGTYSWTVDNSLTDTTPPVATIASKPPDPSQSSTAAFTYSSNEPGSTFECKLDGGTFAPCATNGIQYTGLANGAHSFQVRATDTSLNQGAPAGYSWSVAAPDPTQPPPVLPRSSTPPDTRLTLKPGAITKDRTPTFRFQATINPATFECRLDGAAFKSCRSPFTTKLLSFRRHTVQIRASAGGLIDPSPAKFSFKVMKRKARHR